MSEAVVEDAVIAQDSTQFNVSYQGIFAHVPVWYSVAY